MATKRIGLYHVSDHGIEHSQYFSGHGIAHTEWEDCATGSGDTFNEALADALEQLAESWNSDDLDVIERDNKLDDDRDSATSASAYVNEQANDQFPDEYRLTHTAFCGMTHVNETFSADDLDSAKEQFKAICDDLEHLTRDDHASDDDDIVLQAEFTDPDDATIADDRTGMVTLQKIDRSNNREDYIEGNEITYYVSVDVRAPNDDDDYACLAHEDVGLSQALELDVPCNTDTKWCSQSQQLIALAKGITTITRFTPRKSDNK